MRPIYSDNICPACLIYSEKIPLILAVYSDSLQAPKLLSLSYQRDRKELE